MQYQRGPKPRIVRSVPGARPVNPNRPAERPVRNLVRWEEDDFFDEDEPPRPTLESIRWQDEEVATARRSLPRNTAPSWESVQSEDLIPTIPPPAPPAPPTAASPTLGAIQHAPSVGPVALELDEDAAPRGLRGSGFPVLVFSALGLLALGAVAAGLVMARPTAQSRSHGPSPAAAVHPFTTMTPPRQQEEESSIPPPPILEPPETDETAASPAPTTGMVVGSPDHRLFVDGRRAPGWKLEVKCGTHRVKNGSRGAERTVDVPCGGEAAVAP